jgi:hypothetical protein
MPNCALILMESGMDVDSIASLHQRRSQVLMYGTTDPDGKVPIDLDTCNGHIGATKTKPKGEYHYHATGKFPNLPVCLKGVQANNNFSTTASTGLGSTRGGGGPGGGPPPN